MLVPISKTITDLINNPSAKFLSSGHALFASTVTEELIKLGYSQPFSEELLSTIQVESDSTPVDKFPKEKRVYLNNKLFLIERVEEPGVIQYFSIDCTL